MGCTTAQESQQHQHSPDDNAKEANIDRLGTLFGERSQDLEQGTPITAHPDPQCQQSEATHLSEKQDPYTVHIGKKCVHLQISVKYVQVIPI